MRTDGVISGVLSGSNKPVVSKDNTAVRTLWFLTHGDGVSRPADQ